ncbi:MAG: hypothetical protein G01um101493_450 [Microgenomates group bacterium Gr01-1014_93]|nr:MAG: hypothetical protein G01um101493_450 [Microgenomates group bacterium Gr01-1014_93]
MLTGKENHTHTLPKFDIPILQKLYEFYGLLYQYLKIFPKKDRYSLGQKLESISLDIIESTFEIPRKKGQDKISLLQEASGKLDLLKFLIRLAKDTQALDNKKYVTLEEALQEIGRMLGGWLRATQEKQLPS